MTIDATDSELYEPDIDWFFNQYDSVCGLKSAQGNAILGDGKMRTIGAAGNPVTVRLTGSSKHGKVRGDPWADYGKLVEFGKGRLIWQRLTSLSYSLQSILRSAYSPRHCFSEAEPWGRSYPDRKTIVEAVRAYREVVSGKLL